jgi:hypothetical protein
VTSREDQMQIDAEALFLYQQGLTFFQIAGRQGCIEATAHKRVQRAIRNRYRLEADELRAVEEERLNYLTRRFSALMHKKTYKISVSGKVVTDPNTGQPLEDFSEQRMAGLAMLKVAESKRKLLGLDQPVRHKVEITDKMDAEIERLAQELSVSGAGEPVHAELPAEVTPGDGA